MANLALRTIPAGVAFSAFALFGSPAAQAGPGICTGANTFTIAGPGFTQNFTVDAGGATVTPAGGTGTFSCVQQQDKLFSSFNFAAVPTGSADLNFATVDGIDTHTISLAGSGLSSGNSYTLAYDIEVTDPLTVHLISTKSGILQTSGNSSLAETLADNDGDTFNIGFSQTDATPNVGGNTSTPLDPSVDWLDVTDILTLMPSGSDAAGVSNSFVQSVPTVPEPAPLLIVGAAIVGLGVIRRRGRGPDPAA